MHRPYPVTGVARYLSQNSRTGRWQCRSRCRCRFATRRSRFGGERGGGAVALVVGFAARLGNGTAEGAGAKALIVGVAASARIGKAAASAARGAARARRRVPPAIGPQGGVLSVVVAAPIGTGGRGRAVYLPLSLPPGLKMAESGELPLYEATELLPVFSARSLAAAGPTVGRRVIRGGRVTEALRDRARRRHGIGGVVAAAANGKKKACRLSNRANRRYDGKYWRLR